MKSTKFAAVALTLSLSLSVVPQTDALAPVVAFGVRALFKTAIEKFIEGAGSGLGWTIFTEGAKLLAGDEVPMPPETAQKLVGVLASSNIEVFDRSGRKTSFVSTFPQGGAPQYDSGPREHFVSLDPDNICGGTRLKITYLTGLLRGAGGNSRDAYHVELQGVTIERNSMGQGCQPVVHIKFTPTPNDNINNLNYYIEWAHVRFAGGKMQISNGGTKSDYISRF